VLLFLAELSEVFVEKRAFYVEAREEEYE